MLHNFDFSKTHQVMSLNVICLTIWKLVTLLRCRLLLTSSYCFLLFWSCNCCRNSLFFKWDGCSCSRVWKAVECTTRLVCFLKKNQQQPQIRFSCFCSANKVYSHHWLSWVLVKKLEGAKITVSYLYFLSSRISA